MAVIIREERILEGKKYSVEVYKTLPGKLVMHEEKIKAKKLDEFLSKRMKEICSEIQKCGLLSLKGKRGKVLKLWYEVGRRLEFVMDTSIIVTEEREFVWRAIYDHAGKLAPGRLTKRAMRNPKTSHFSYCHKLSEFPWNFVESAGNWTSWRAFFDRSELTKDSRIIEWLEKKAKKFNGRSRQNWLRPLTKAIHNEFIKSDTSFFSRNELYERLESIFLQEEEWGRI